MNLGFESGGQFIIWLTLMAIGALIWNVKEKFLVFWDMLKMKESDTPETYYARHATGEQNE